MEIERKFLVTRLPLNIFEYPCDQIAQGYVSTSPVIRIRQKNASYFLTCKSKGLMAREEFEIEISTEEYLKLQCKIDYKMISKKRYYIPLNDTHIIELDIFEGHLQGLLMAEVEFSTLEEAFKFQAPLWFEKELTEDFRFQNSHLCQINNLDELI